MSRMRHQSWENKSFKPEIENLGMIMLKKHGSMYSSEYQQ